MRYRIGEDPAVAAYGSSDTVVLVTVVMSLFIGALLLWLAMRGRQRWLAVWSAGLVVASVAYLGWVGLGGG